jgi:hypothetical protein
MALNHRMWLSSGIRMWLSSGMAQEKSRRDPGTTVVSQRRQRTVPLIVAIAVFILGMAGGLAAQPTVSGRVTAVIFFGLLIGLCIGAVPRNWRLAT